jgi:predicted component of type VI protein secretion system
MQVNLVVVSGKAGNQVVALKLPTVVGRSRQASVTVAHPMISRRHCEIFEQNGVVMLRDLGSLNGTHVGGRRIQLSPLLPDGEFVIGPMKFRVQYEFTGDLADVPNAVFLDVAEEPAQTQAPAAADAVDEDLSYELDDESPAAAAGPAAPAAAANGEAEAALPDFLAWADGDEDQTPPAREESSMTVDAPEPADDGAGGVKQTRPPSQAELAAKWAAAQKNKIPPETAP